MRQLKCSTRPGWRDSHASSPRKEGACRLGAPRLVGMAACLMMILLSACAVGPNFDPPSAPEVGGYTPEPLAHRTASSPGPEGKAQRFVQDLDIPAQWWATFHSRPLNDLIEDALRRNADLQAAQAALRVAHENAEAQKGLFAPQIGGEFNPTGGKTGVDVAPILNTTSPYYSLATTQLTVAYTPDVFGLN